MSIKAGFAFFARYKPQYPAPESQAYLGFALPDKIHVAGDIAVYRIAVTQNEVRAPAADFAAVTADRKTAIVVRFPHLPQCLKKPDFGRGAHAFSGKPASQTQSLARDRQHQKLGNDERMAVSGTAQRHIIASDAFHDVRGLRHKRDASRGSRAPAGSYGIQFRKDLVADEVT